MRHCSCVVHAASVLNELLVIVSLRRCPVRAATTAVHFSSNPSIPYGFFRAFSHDEIYAFIFAPLLSPHAVLLVASLRRGGSSTPLHLLRIFSCL